MMHLGRRKDCSVLWMLITHVAGNCLFSTVYSSPLLILTDYVLELRSQYSKVKVDAFDVPPA